MKLNNRGGNATTIEVGPVTVLFSYATPVAAHVQGIGFFRTTEHHSATTSKHINGWLRAEGSGDSFQCPPETFGQMLNPNPETLAELQAIKLGSAKTVAIRK